jgi:CHAD domain-containing protein
MAPLSKWIDGLVPDGSVSDAARKSLEARLATVAYWLPLAARPVDGDLERVHQLRVATRRAVAALKLYRDWLPRNKRRWLTKRLKKVRRAAGDARDLDVLAARLRKENGDQGAEVATLLTNQRASLHPPILAIADSCHEDNRLHRKTYKLLAQIGPQDAAASTQDANFRSWAALRLHAVAGEFFAAQPEGGSDLSALHRFRIVGKKLRYTMELLAPAFGPELRETLYPIVQELQEKLGNVNDYVVGRNILEHLRANGSISTSDQLDTLIQAEETSRDHAIAEFRQWWTPERAETLRNELAP